MRDSPHPCASSWMILNLWNESDAKNILSTRGSLGTAVTHRRDKEVIPLRAAFLVRGMAAGPQTIVAAPRPTLIKTPKSRGAQSRSSASAVPNGPPSTKIPTTLISAVSGINRGILWIAWQRIFMLTKKKIPTCLLV